MYFIDNFIAQATRVHTIDFIFKFMNAEVMAAGDIESNELHLVEHKGLASHTSIWIDTKCKDLVENQTVICIQASDSLKIATNVLFEHGISSAPVYDQEHHHFIGMLDYRDLVAFLLSELEKGKNAMVAQNADLNHVIQMYGHPTAREKWKWVLLPVDLSKKNPFYTVPAYSSLYQAVEIFSEGIHRIAVQESRDAILGILTQSNVSSYLYANIESIPIAKRSLQELGICHSSVISISPDATVLHALMQMQKYSFTSLPIVDDGGKLIGSISMKDVLRVGILYVLIRDRHFRSLWETCQSFVSQIRLYQGIKEDGGKDRYPFFDVYLRSSLEHAMGKMEATKCHRLWIVDDRLKLIGVLSLTDVLRLLKPSIIE